MVESSRIARGAVENVASLTADSNIDALVFPGGFGAAKNLSDFAFKGTEMTVDPEIERILKEFKASGKPIALCCIAPILAAKVLGTEVIFGSLLNHVSRLCLSDFVSVVHELIISVIIV